MSGFSNAQKQESDSSAPKFSFASAGVKPAFSFGSPQSTSTSSAPTSSVPAFGQTSGTSLFSGVGTSSFSFGTSGSSSLPKLSSSASTSAPSSKSVTSSALSSSSFSFGSSASASPAALPSSENTISVEPASGLFGSKPTVTSAPLSSSPVFPSQSAPASSNSFLPSISSKAASQEKTSLFGADTKPFSFISTSGESGSSSSLSSLSTAKATAPKSTSTFETPVTTNSNTLASTPAFGSTANTAAFTDSAALSSIISAPTTTTASASTVASSALGHAVFPASSTKEGTASFLQQPGTTKTTSATSLSGHTATQTSAIAKDIKGAAPPSAEGSCTVITPATTLPGSLKNKSMEAIISQWTTALTKYSKEYQVQAEDIAKWDRELIENGDKISQLFTETLQAEQMQVKVEQQLTYTSKQQDDLEETLNIYEKEVDNLLATIGASDGMQPPDNERERMYHLAERLNKELDQLGKNLSSMIEEVNRSSATLNHTKDDDPLSHIVRILNAHLASLQWIDTNTGALNDKIEEIKILESRLRTRI
ncbi:Nsp1-like C-terminal region-domain-containing protein [Lipomyces oligophaga]|uniref:Nsp1-like C-terminal region-domain-containing protein n=1 Tax=Lipomyces oligophaga TaxID=45792 RepID=UPI0034CF31FB